jgi:hypothetical protein
MFRRNILPPSSILHGILNQKTTAPIFFTLYSYILQYTIQLQQSIIVKVTTNRKIRNDKKGNVLVITSKHSVFAKQ